MAMARTPLHLAQKLLFKKTSVGKSANKTSDELHEFNFNQNSFSIHAPTHEATFSNKTKHSRRSCSRIEVCLLQPRLYENHFIVRSSRCRSLLLAKDFITDNSWQRLVAGSASWDKVSPCPYARVNFFFFALLVLPGSTKVSNKHETKKKQQIPQRVSWYYRFTKQLTGVSLSPLRWKTQIEMRSFIAKHQLLSLPY